MEAKNKAGHPLLLPLLDWQGGYADLVKKAREIISFLAKTAPTQKSLDYPKAAKINLRLLQHYVTKHVVGPVSTDEFDRRQVLFGQRELLQVVVLRLMIVDGWSLAHLKDTVWGVTRDELLTLLASLVLEGVDAPVSKQIALADLYQYRPRTPVKLVAEFIGAVKQVPKPEEWLLFRLTPWAIVLLSSDEIDEASDELFETVAENLRTAIKTVQRRRRRRGQ